jgi:hypothetical protein
VAALLLGLVAFGGGGFPAQVGGLVAIPALVVAGSWLALALLGRAALPRLSRPALTATGAAVAMVALTVLSIAWSASGERSWTETNRALAYVALGTVGALAAAARPDARALAGVVASILGAALGWALLGRAIPSLGPDLSIPGQTHRLVGAVGYANGLALLAATAVPLALWAVSERPRWARAGGEMLLVAALVAGALTYSRAGLALAVGVAVLWIWRARPQLAPLLAFVCAALLALPAVVLDVAGAGGTAFGIAVVAALVLAATLGPRLPDVRVAREERVVRSAALAGAGILLLGLLAVTVHDGGPVAFVQARWHEFANAQPGKQSVGRLANVGSYRWSWWKEAFRGFAGRPVGGHGAGSFGLTHLHYRHDALSITQEPHSMPLQLLTELGLIGFILVAVGAYGVLRVARTVASRPAHDREARVALALVPVLAVVHALVDLDWEILAVDGFAVFTAGVLVALGAPGLARRTPRFLAAAGVGVVTLAALYSVAAPLLARAQLDKALSDPLAAGKSAQLAHAYDPLSVAALLRRAQAAHLDGDDGAAHGFYLEATRLEPENPLPWTELGNFEWRVVGDVCSAYQAFNRAYTDDPASAVPGGALDRTRRAVNRGACG